MLNLTYKALAQWPKDISHVCINKPSVLQPCNLIDPMFKYLMPKDTI